MSPYPSRSHVPGISIAASDHVAMPEVFGHGVAGAISPRGDAAALGANILNLPDENRRFGAAARAHFERRFSSQAVMPLIRGSYERALGAPAHRVT